MSDQKKIGNKEIFLLIPTCSTKDLDQITSEKINTKEKLEEPIKK